MIQCHEIHIICFFFKFAIQGSSNARRDFRSSKGTLEAATAANSTTTSSPAAASSSAAAPLLGSCGLRHDSYTLSTLAALLPAAVTTYVTIIYAAISCNKGRNIRCIVSWREAISLIICNTLHPLPTDPIIHHAIHSVFRKAPYWS